MCLGFTVARLLLFVSKQQATTFIKSRFYSSLDNHMVMSSVVESGMSLMYCRNGASMQKKRCIYATQELFKILMAPKWASFLCISFLHDLFSLPSKYFLVLVVNYLRILSLCESLSWVFLFSQEIVPFVQPAWNDNKVNSILYSPPSNKRWDRV